jgi:hypothetical protein
MIKTSWVHPKYAWFSKNQPKGLKTANQIQLMDTTKDLVIKILTEEYPLSAKSIYTRVTKKHLKPITYQAVFKTIKKMEDEGILEKDKGYSLNIDWVLRSKEFFSQIEKHYKSKDTPEIPYSEAHLHEYSKYSFGTSPELAHFLVRYYLRFPNPKNKPNVFRWYFVYPLIGLPNEIVQDIKRLARTYQYYIVSNSNTLYDKIIAKTFSLFAKNVHIKTGVECSGEGDFMIVGDYVLRVYFSPQFKEGMREFKSKSKTAQTFSLNKLFDLMHKKHETPHRVIIDKNPSIAEQIRKDTLKIFNVKWK